MTGLMLGWGTGFPHGLHWSGWFPFWECRLWCISGISPGRFLFPSLTRRSSRVATTGSPQRLKPRHFFCFFRHPSVAGALSGQAQELKPCPDTNLAIHQISEIRSDSVESLHQAQACCGWAEWLGVLAANASWIGSRGEQAGLLRADFFHRQRFKPGGTVAAPGRN